MADIAKIVVLGFAVLIYSRPGALDQQGSNGLAGAAVVPSFAVFGQPAT